MSLQKILGKPHIIDTILSVMKSGGSMYDSEVYETVQCTPTTRGNLSDPGPRDGATVSSASSALTQACRHPLQSASRWHICVRRVSLVSQRPRAGHTCKVDGMKTEVKRYPDLPWVVLEDIHEAEAWLDLYNRELQQLIPAQQQSQGQGVCFTLLHGGELYLHTNSDGDILLDVLPEAAWAVPVLSAITGMQPPRGQVWLIAAEHLLPLVLGLNSLIASTRLVLQHDFGLRRQA